MKKLALFGGEMAIKGPIAKYNSIGEKEASFVEQCVLGYPLSGYLGGRDRGGHWVQRLEERWADKFGVRHAIAVNSATSGLLAATRAIEVGAGDSFITTPFSMSATVAAPSFFGAQPVFVDIAADDFCLEVADVEHALEHRNENIRAIVVTNLFGGPARLKTLRELADRYSCSLIEDNAQSILATENGRYAGTIGHIGVFSLNVHKHIQCGEGGMVVTNDDETAQDIRRFINHGEMWNDRRGLNLRMPEVCAAIALAQFDRVEELVQERMVQASLIRDAIRPFQWIGQAAIRRNTRHVFYMVPFHYSNADLVLPHRDRITEALRAEGLPLVDGYVSPLQKLQTFKSGHVDTPVAQGMHDHFLFQFSNCEWTLTNEQIEQIPYAFEKVVRAVDDGELM